MPTTNKALIVTAQYFIFLKAVTEDSEKALFLSMQPNSLRVWYRAIKNGIAGMYNPNKIGV
jgi:hypothetical protein